MLKKLKNDWKAVCFVLLSKNFELNVNGAAFLEVAKTIPFSVIRKNWNEGQSLEALFLKFIQNQNQFDTAWLFEVEVYEYWKTHYVLEKVLPLRVRTCPNIFRNYL